MHNDDGATCWECGYRRKAGEDCYTTWRYADRREHTLCRKCSDKRQGAILARAFDAVYATAK
jgi:hypothetical protein